MIVAIRTTLRRRVCTYSRQSHNGSWRSSLRGFSLMEMLIVMAIIGILAALAIPAFQTAVRRARLMGYVQATTLQMRRARIEAIKRSQRVGVHIDPVSRTVSSFVDLDGSCSPSTGDTTLTITTEGSQWLKFEGPTGTASFLDGLQGTCPTASPPSPSPSGGWVVFDGSGSAEGPSGAVRFGDQNGNFVEIRVDPPATGKIQARKWDPVATAWIGSHEGGSTWEWF